MGKVTTDIDRVKGVEVGCMEGLACQIGEFFPTTGRVKERIRWMYETPDVSNRRFCGYGKW